MSTVKRLRCEVSYQLAVLFQRYPIGLISEISRRISPFPKVEGCVDPIMIEVIRERIGVSSEEFYKKLEEIRRASERKELGLPA